MKPLNFLKPEAWRKYPFRAEPPRIGYRREYPHPHGILPYRCTLVPLGISRYDTCFRYKKKFQTEPHFLRWYCNVLVWEKGTVYTSQKLRRPCQIRSELNLKLNPLISVKGYCKYFNLVELLSWAVKGKLTVEKVNRNWRHSSLIFKQHCTLPFNGHSFRFNENNS